MAEAAHCLQLNRVLVGLEAICPAGPYSSRPAEAQFIGCNEQIQPTQTFALAGHSVHQTQLKLHASNPVCLRLK